MGETSVIPEPRVTGCHDTCKSGVRGEMVDLGEIEGSKVTAENTRPPSQTLGGGEWTTSGVTVVEASGVGHR